MQTSRASLRSASLELLQAFPHNTKSSSLKRAKIQPVSVGGCERAKTKLEGIQDRNNSSSSKGLSASIPADEHPVLHDEQEGLLK